MSAAHVQAPTSTRLREMAQETAYASPWTWKTKLALVAWSAVWLLLFRPTPKPFSPWRVLLLRLFGCRVKGVPFVDASVKIKMPWNLTLHDRACLGPDSEVYNLGRVTLKERCTIAQQVYVCGGTHDLSTPRLPLIVGDIVVEEDVFIGARAFVLPGVTIGRGAVIGACAVVTRDMPSWMICAGNPCKPLKQRPFDEGT